jgi:hypothetical protein
VPANAVPLPIKPTTLLSGAFAAGVVPIAAETKDCNR